MNDLQNTMTSSAPVLLRQAREASGLHIAALAAFLKVPVKKLEALEAGRYDELPDMTFARALASSACRHLKVDPAPVLEQIPTAHKPPLGDSPQAINTPFKGPAATPAFNPAGWLSRPAIFAAFALLIGALVLMFFPASPVVPPDAVLPPAGAQSEASTPTQGSDQMAPSTDTTASLEPIVSPAQILPDAAKAAVLAAPLGNAVPQAAPVGVVASVTSVASASASLLSIVATDETWVEVVNGNRSQVVQRVLKAGDVMNFSSAPPYSVVIGRSDAAQVTVRGRPFDTAPFARNSVARFEVE